jgi:hypothetical protein
VGPRVVLDTVVKRKITETIILPAVFYGRGTWTFIEREEHRLWVYENTMLRRIFGPKREEVVEAGEDSIMTIFITCTFHQTLFGR